MSMLIDPVFHMWFSLIVTGVAVFAFIREKFPIEVTSIAVLTVLMLFGQFFPLPNEAGRNLMDPYALLAGFANPSLIAVLALLVMGQAMIQSEALRAVTRVFTVRDKKKAWYSVVVIMLFVLIVSAFMNNTPLVIIAIPLLQTLANSIHVSESRFMIPLSYVAILGGMTTLIGSSTNLLVSSTMVELGYESLQFFDFIVPGIILACVGFIYVLVFLPRLLPERDNMSRGLVGNTKEFVAELEVAGDSKLVGLSCPEGKFQDLTGFSDLSVKLVQRAGHLTLPPFEDYEVKENDILIVAATRETLMDLLSKYPGFLLSEEEVEVIQRGGAQNDENGQLSENRNAETRVLAEIMITPASRMIDMSLDHANFHRQFGMIVLGIQRRAKVVRRRLGRIRLESGDVLLVTGRRIAIDALRYNPDFIVLSGSKRDLPVPGKAPLALGVFFLTIALAALGVLSIPAAAVAGSAMMIATGCLNIRQATRAIDRKIFLLVGSMLALGTALQASGGAEFVASLITMVPFTDTPIAMLAVLFILVAIATNILSNNACAILFTPIALSLAQDMFAINADVDWNFIFAVTVIFAANCSFASPIGYQTNLLVMGPGHYRFRDYLSGGVPLVLILWVAYIFLLKYYFAL